MTKLVCGIGFNDGKYPSWFAGKAPKEYALWSSLLKRCYSPITHKIRPTYIGCSVSENFKSYSYFYEWVKHQIGFDRENYHLDKDLTLKGNKLYSEETCLFLPRELNALITINRVSRGSLPIGVCANQGRFLAQCGYNSTSRYVGRFKTPEEAFQAYKETKETYIRLQAEKWKALIDPRAFATLMGYEVQITD